LELRELAENQRDGLANPQIGIHRDAVMTNFDEANGDREEELAALGLLFQCFQRSLPENRQFHLAHSALHSEQKSIIGQARIIRSVMLMPLFVWSWFDDQVISGACLKFTQRGDTAGGVRKQKPIVAGISVDLDNAGVYAPLDPCALNLKLLRHILDRQPADDVASPCRLGGLQHAVALSQDLHCAWPDMLAPR
jgi:hypothetical protein